jgi:tRNA pseudouridine38-40 synthase
VQQTIEEAIARLRGGRGVELTVAGRTDRGVHAWGQIVSHPGEPAPLEGLNALLPADVAVLSCEPAPDGFDARRDAVSRTYCFRLHTRTLASPFEVGRALHWPYALDRDALAACAAALVGRHDFTAFTPTETEHVRFDRVVLSAGWHRRGETLELWITADAFMRHMNRVLIGTMLEVAGGRRSLESFLEMLEGPAWWGGRRPRPTGCTSPRSRSARPRRHAGR